MQEVEQLCTRVAIINRGRIQVEGTVPELRDRYSDNVTVRLRAAPAILGEVASWNGLSEVERGDDLQILEGQWGQVWPVVEKLVSRPALREEIKELHMSGLSFEDVYIRVVNE
jgi:ABC-type multidrug transport system ATPase subunit